MNRAEECLICGSPLEYIDKAEWMECSICHHSMKNNVRCKNGHFVCDECHTAGIDKIIGICMTDSSSNPIEIIEKLMSLDTCHMHGPEHHVMVGASIITAYKNAGGDVDLPWALTEMVRRGKQIPGGACGNWGACGAGISTGIAVSIITRSTPLAKEAWGLSNLMTSNALANIARHGGPRCCKRDSYEAVLSAIDFIGDKLGVKLHQPNCVVCSRSAMNNQCLGSQCPFKMKTFQLPNR